MALEFPHEIWADEHPTWEQFALCLLIMAAFDDGSMSPTQSLKWMTAYYWAEIEAPNMGRND